MQKLKKHFYKIVLGISCVLLALSIAFAAYSFAKYVSSAGTGSNGADVAPVDCSLTVNGGGNNAFINAPFMQKVSDKAEAVQMNQFAESVLTVKNFGKKLGLKYEYGFVFYMPEELFDNAMFQLVRLGNSNATETRGAVSPTVISSAEYASLIYKAYPVGGGYEIRQATLEGVDEIPDDYAYLSGNGKELVLDSHAEYYGNVEGDLTCTYTTFYTERHGTDEDGTAVEVQNMMCPIEVKKKKSFRYCKLTVNLPVEEEYVLDEGEEMNFLFRIVLNTAMDPSLFSEKVWNAADYYDAEQSVLYDYDNAPVTAEGFKCRWRKGEGDSAPVLEAARAQSGTGFENWDWREVEVRECIGFSAPVRVNAVFTQTR